MIHPLSPQGPAMNFKIKFYEANLLLFSFFLILTSCTMQNRNPQPSAGGSESNPLFQESTLPYHTIPFDKIKETDFVPAFEKGMQEEMKEVDHIATDTAIPSFENVFVALERSGQVLKRTNLAFNVLTSANTDDRLQQIQEAMAARLSAHSDSIYMNAKLFHKIDTLYKQLNKLSLDPESKRLVEHCHQQFVMNGAALPDSSKEQLKN